MVIPPEKHDWRGEQIRRRMHRAARREMIGCACAAYGLFFAFAGFAWLLGSVW
tara:strand:- start:11933 stop:12091 length:159 start_codon:yes stop_codon:yes gene_type:complete